jgi:hypothetical protein
MEFPAFDQIDAITRQNTVRFGLRQQLLTRRDGLPWNLLELTGWTDWRIEQNDGERDLSNLFGTIEVRPFDWVAVRGFGRYDYRSRELRELNTEARVGDTDRWSVGLGTRYLRDDSNLVSWNLAARLTRHWVVQTYQRVDAQDGLWEEQDYMLRQETHDWFISYGFRHRSQRTKADEMAVYLAFSLKAFPHVQLAATRLDLGTGD